MNNDKNGKWWVIGGLSAFAMVMCFLLTLGMANSTANAQVAVPVQAQKTQTTVMLNGLRMDIVTVTHDSHRWVAARVSGSGTLIHHPDCPCGKAR